MQKGHKRLFMLLLILTALFICGFSATTANAAGFKKMNGKTYYIKSDGSKAKGWLKIGKRRYYFNKITGAQIKGWVKTSTGKKRYLLKVPVIWLPGGSMTQMEIRDILVQKTVI